MSLSVAVVLLASTAQGAAEPAPPADRMAAPETEVRAADGGPVVGKFRITLPDGTVMFEEVRADGTFSDIEDGEVVYSGRWEQKSPGLYCYTGDEEGAEQACNVEQVDEAGVWTTQTPEGEVSIVERLAE